MKLIFPAERSISPNNFVILSKAKSYSIFIGITNSMKFFYTEVVVAGSKYQFKTDFVIEKTS